jgi:hypothetical protein
VCTDSVYALLLIPATLLMLQCCFCSHRYAAALQRHSNNYAHTHGNTQTHVKQDKDKRGTVTRLQWANGLKLVLQLDVPFLSYLERLADVDADGNVNYTNFLERYRVQVSVLACIHACMQPLCVLQYAVCQRTAIVHFQDIVRSVRRFSRSFLSSL